MKRLLLPLLALISAFPTFSINRLKNIDPKRVVFAWDAHDTVVKQDRFKRFKLILKTVWHNILRSRTARHILFDHLNDKGWCGGEVLEDKYRILAHEYLEYAQVAVTHGNIPLADLLTQKEQDERKNADKQINPAARKKHIKKAEWYHKRAKKARKGKSKKLAKQYREKAARMLKLAHVFHNFELSYGTMNGAKELIEALKAHGYTQHNLASNIGIKHFEHLKAQHSEIFNDDMIQDGLAVNAWQDPVVKKPDHAYFHKLRTIVDPNNDNKVIVFIDDKKENVKAAERCGMIGIQTKDIKYLVKQLNAEGINLTYSSRKVRENGKKRKHVVIA